MNSDRGEVQTLHVDRLVSLPSLVCDRYGRTPPTAARERAERRPAMRRASISATGAAEKPCVPQGNGQNWAHPDHKDGNHVK
jgi:hypothetical protein